MSVERGDGVPRLVRIVSGGQTGVDRAALDVALAARIPCGGWCPRGRRSEDGPIPRRYPLRETPGADYDERTRRNVRDSDGTLILTRGAPSGGTRLTLLAAKSIHRPVWVVDLAAAIAIPGGVDPDAARIAPARAWIGRHRVGILNVAGPRESQAGGIHREAAAFLRRLLGIAMTGD